MNERLRALQALGQSIWIDALSRDLVRGGELERLVRESCVTGVTSNPTIFAEAFGGDAYREQMTEIARDRSPDDVLVELAATDVRGACDLLGPVWEATGGADGFVSLEVDPRLAYDAWGSFKEAARLHELVDRRNLLVKIPATGPGVTAIEESIASGRSINVTLIFSVERYRAVAEAYLRGLERLVAAGGKPATVASVASFFVSRVDSEVDRQLAAGTTADDGLRGQAAIANARLAYAEYERLFAGDRWAFLKGKGARPQRCLWASTSVKDPAYRDVRYVEELIGPDTVTTVPLETLAAFADHGEARPTLRDRSGEARAVVGRLQQAGIDLEQVAEVLEADGVQRFADAYARAAGRIREFAGSDPVDVASAESFPASDPPAFADATLPATEETEAPGAPRRSGRRSP